MKIPLSFRKAAMFMVAITILNTTGCASTNVTMVTNLQEGTITVVKKISLPRPQQTFVTNEMTLYVCDDCGHQFTWTSTSEPPRCVLHDKKPCPPTTVHIPPPPMTYSAPAPTPPTTIIVASPPPTMASPVPPQGFFPPSTYNMSPWGPRTSYTRTKSSSDYETWTTTW